MTRETKSLDAELGEMMRWAKQRGQPTYDEFLATYDRVRKKLTRTRNWLVGMNAGCFVMNAMLGNHAATLVSVFALVFIAWKMKGLPENPADLP